MAHTRRQADVTTGDGSNPGDDLGNDPGDDLDDDPGDGLDDDLGDGLGDDLDDDVMERLRRLDPVDVESLPSSRRAEAMRTLEEILGPPENAGESEGEVDDSSVSPAANDRGGQETSPPCPTSR